MADIVLQRNIGAYIAVVTSVFPQSSVAATINGVSIDRALHHTADSCLLDQSLGAVTGSPSAISAQTTLQHSPDNSTWTNYEPDGVTAQQTPVGAAASADSSVAINLTSAYRYIRAVTVVGFTGGTTPAALVAAVIVLGGEDRLPAA